MDEQKPSNTGGTDADNSAPHSTNGQFMDIQTPKPSSFSSGGSAPLLEQAAPEEASSSDNATDSVAEAPPVIDEPTSSTPVEDASNSSETPNEPAQETPAEPASPPTNINVTSSDDTSTNETQSASTPAEAPASPPSENNPLAIPPAQPKKGGKPTLVIVIAVVVALGLASLVVFTFLKTKKDTVGTPNKAANSTSSQTAAKPLASPADVDATNKEMETSLNKVNDSTDFAATDLSDKSLGL